MKTKYKYVYFEKAKAQDCEEVRWKCLNKYKVCLGYIAKYEVGGCCFLPEHGTCYATKNLKEVSSNIIDFMKQLEKP